MKPEVKVPEVYSTSCLNAVVVMREGGLTEQEFLAVAKDYAAVLEATSDCPMCKERKVYTDRHEFDISTNRIRYTHLIFKQGEYIGYGALVDGWHTRTYHWGEKTSILPFVTLVLLVSIHAPDKIVFDMRVIESHLEEVEDAFKGIIAHRHKVKDEISFGSATGALLRMLREKAKGEA